MLQYDALLILPWERRLDLHELKQLFQQHFTDGLVTVVGSGLSCAEGLPGMGDLASHLQETVEADLAEHDRGQWKELSPLISAKGLEAALHERPPTPTLEATIVARSAELIAQRERHILAEVFARKRTLRFSRLLKHLLKPPAGIPVVTTNYDRLIEVAAEEAGLGADTLFIGHFAGELNDRESRRSFIGDVKIHGKSVRYIFKDRIIVYKPHGSLDWYFREGKPVHYAGELSLPRLIITPGINKFRNGYESPFDRHRELANRAIDTASRFLILGYGFNDDHLETHLTPRIKSGVPTLLITRTLSANALKLVLENSKFIAIQRDFSGSKVGTSVFLNKERLVFPDVVLWDLDAFISEVLEP